MPARVCVYARGLDESIMRNLGRNALLSHRVRIIRTIDLRPIRR